MPADRQAEQPRSPALAAALNNAVRTAERRRGRPVTPSELAARIDGHLGAEHTYTPYQAKKVLRGYVKFIADGQLYPDEQGRVRDSMGRFVGDDDHAAPAWSRDGHGQRLLAAWVAAFRDLGVDLDAGRLLAAARQVYDGEDVTVTLATTSDRWATRTARPRDRSRELADMLNDALDEWGSRRGQPVTVGELATAITRHLRAAKDDPTFSFRHKQVQRLLGLEGDEHLPATPDHEIVDACVAVIPTLDREQVAVWWLGGLAAGLDARRLRRVLTANGRAPNAASDQDKGNKRHYDVSPGSANYGDELVEAGMTAALAS
jgi:hypothetical protein